MRLTTVLAMVLLVGCAERDRSEAKQVVQAGAPTGAPETRASGTTAAGSLERWESFDFTKNLVYPTEAALLPLVEKANVALIAKREDALHQALATQELSATDLRGIPPEEARLLRNEIYARHGRRFRDPRLQRYFEDFAWYSLTITFARASSARRSGQTRS